MRFENLKPEDFEIHWKGCSDQRLNMLQNQPTSEIFKKWPYYKRPNGHQLVRRIHIVIDYDIDYFFRET